MRRLGRLLAPLRSREFTLVWLGQSISLLGDECSSIALIWLLVGMTGSSLLLGAVLSTSYVPTLLLLLLGGALVDRVSGWAVALVSDGLRALVTAVFATLVTLGIITLPEVFVFAAIYGLVGAFFNPAVGALYPSLVVPERYEAATSLRQMTTQVATLCGPALAGYLIARWNVGAAMSFDAVSFALAFLGLALGRRAFAQARREASPAPTVTERDPATKSATRGASRWKQMFAGLGFLRGEPGVLTLILFFSLTNGLNNVMLVLVPRLVRDDLGLSAAAFGLLASFMGGGALLGALVAGLIAPRLRRRAQVICVSMIVFGVAIVTMGLAYNAITLDVAFAVTGVAFAVPEVIFGGLLQRIIPADMRGRVYSLVGLIAMAMNPAGFFLAGALGDAFGPRTGLWVGGGAITLLATLALLYPAVRALNGYGTPTDNAEALAPATVAER